jgi:hypothetical protein
MSCVHTHSDELDSDDETDPFSVSSLLSCLHPIQEAGGGEVYGGPLSGSGKYTAVLLNRAPHTMKITLHFSDLVALLPNNGGNVGGNVVGKHVQPRRADDASMQYSVRDIVNGVDLGTHAGNFTQTVRSHAVAHLVLQSVP